MNRNPAGPDRPLKPCTWAGRSEQAVEKAPSAHVPLILRPPTYFRSTPPSSGLDSARRRASPFGSVLRTDPIPPHSIPKETLWRTLHLARLERPAPIHFFTRLRYPQGVAKSRGRRPSEPPGPKQDESTEQRQARWGYPATQTPWLPEPGSWRTGGSGSGSFRTCSGWKAGG